MAEDRASRLEVVTGCGSFTIRLHRGRAPETCRYFAGLARSGRLDGTSVFRIVTPSNESTGASEISIVQLGLRGEQPQERVRVRHESTRQTGLAHRRWTVSAARFRLGELYGSFFVCMRDEPSLDHGGGRNPDGEGFAAFGEVVSGHETLLALYERAGPTPMLEAPISVQRIRAIARERAAGPGHGAR